MLKPEPDPGLLVRLAKSLVNERAAYISRERSREAKQYRVSQDALLEATKAIGKSGDISLILTAEAGFLRNDMRFFSDSAAMRSSLTTALTELDLAQKMLPVVGDSDLYLAVDVSHGMPKSRIGGVPRDAARQFFQSHNARLLNADKSRLTDTEKQILDAAGTTSALPRWRIPPYRRKPWALAWSPIWLSAFLCESPGHL
jgi:hypothetical protein